MAFHYPIGAGGGGSVSISGSDSIVATPNPITNTGSLSLVNDSGTPGVFKYYGTDGSGTKGWFSLNTGSITGSATLNQVSYGTGAGSIGSNSSFTYNPSGSFNVGFGSTNFLNINSTNGNISLGDINAVFGGYLFTLNPGSALFSLNTTLSMNGFKITNLATPTLGTDATNKAYVDSLALGLSWKTAVKAATVTNLPTYTYNNGASGVGATITSLVFGALPTIDGISLNVGDRVLIKNETVTNTPFNGIYTVTVVGSVSASFVLTRSTDDNTGTQMVSATVAVSQGATNMNTAWTQTTPATITMGTSNIVFAMFLSNTYAAGTGLTLTGNTFSVNPSQIITQLSNFSSNGLLKTNGGTGVLSIATPGTDYQAPISLTTTGTSGPATFIANTLNIPNYTSGGGSTDLENYALVASQRFLSGN